MRTAGQRPRTGMAAGRHLPGKTTDRLVCLGGEGPLKMHHEFRVSISDCPNACSRPQIVEVGIIGACVPEITDATCTACGACLEVCRENAIVLSDDGPALDVVRCLYCGKCARACSTGTLREGPRGYRLQVDGRVAGDMV